MGVLPKRINRREFFKFIKCLIKISKNSKKHRFYLGANAVLIFYKDTYMFFKFVEKNRVSST